MIYSIQLTFVALAVIPFFVLLTLSISPIIKRQIREKNIATANLQSHMVETISSLDTIKGQGIEIPSEWKWGQLYGKQMQAGFKNIVTRSISGSTSNFLSQLSGLLVIWAGASLVLQGKLTIGQLIETLLGKVLLELGLFGDGTSFGEFQIKDICKELTKLFKNLEFCTLPTK